MFCAVLQPKWSIGCTGQGHLLALLIQQTQTLNPNTYPAPVCMPPCDGSGPLARRNYAFGPAKVVRPLHHASFLVIASDASWLVCTGWGWLTPSPAHRHQTGWQPPSKPEVVSGAAVSKLCHVPECSSLSACFASQVLMPVARDNHGTSAVCKWGMESDSTGAQSCMVLHHVVVPASLCIWVVYSGKVLAQQAACSFCLQSD